MRTLLYKNSDKREFTDGLNYTIRLGTYHADLPPGQPIELVDTDSRKKFAEAKVVGVTVCNIEDLYYLMDFLPEECGVDVCDTTDTYTDDFVAHLRKFYPYVHQDDTVTVIAFDNFVQVPSLKFEVGKQYKDQFGTIWVCYDASGDGSARCVQRNTGCVGLFSRDGVGGVLGLSSHQLQVVE